VDGAGDVYVLDAGNDRVQEWAPGATSGVTVAGGNGAGSAANQLDSPTGLAVTDAGNIYVVDTGNLRLQEWAAGATTGRTLEGGVPCENEYYCRILSNPIGVFASGSGAVYVSMYR
jgi:hypothetical protein